MTFPVRPLRPPVARLSAPKPSSTVKWIVVSSGLATIGSTAPFVGLFGTVVGIINAFKGISSEKSTGLGAVAGGISEALVTTAFGLFVAIPAVWMFNYFNGRVKSFDVEMDELQFRVDRLLPETLQ